MKRSGFAVMARLIGLVRPLAGYMALAVAMGLAGHLCATWITVLGGFGILRVLGLEAPLPLTGLFVAAAVMAVLRAVLRYGEQACNHFIAFKLLALLRDKVFRALRRLAPAKLEGREKGDLIAVITSDIELLEVFYAHTISPALIALLFSGLLTAFIGSYHPLLGALALAAYAVVGLAVPLAVSRASGQEGLRLRNEAGALAAFVLDSLRGLPEILQYGAGASRLQQMQDRTEALSRREARLKAAAGRGTAATQLILWCFDLAMLFAASALYLRGAVDFAGVLLPTLALMSSFGPVVALANLGATLQNTFAAGNRVLDILEETPLVRDIHGQPDVTFAGAGAEDVTFGYGEETILQNVTVPVPAGRTIGIVGRSGSGKSTLLKLFLRFWQVEQGRVQLSGRSVEQINTQNLRRMQALVTQETHLFQDSIRNNLRIARQDATDAELVAACKKASIHDFIAALPRGYDTPVGELGDTLSGGERQRLGLARAFLHDAPFLLLDEPTSNLDSLNEAVILRALAEEHGKRTVVLVSHRVSTMGIADTVYSVENGRVS
ncbi:thiol reductant ABC exporter subunit CydC [Subdoligranulum variabile]|uniref:Thiol reductant ABC exporter, CydC subunit n=1 Tax=Subdoligranulum variabile DSM 15176 TaxID=411471 RepID=D1PIL3_9FIRM|nr:thiol reductant ABC exporter subunit CydC [Subdoligranulum variabile]EFB77372.1 thiol reductant ABC exporter, CydC subunit [Subdoligranulum variabile DSM 15176]UWP67267.1 thiol reductant ABC exporter subunit CydC [Subdoligranulum variabile]